MKKFLYSAAALALAFFAASCQQENLEPAVSANTVTYTVEVPGALATRALGDETTAVDKVYYQVYRAAEVEDLSKVFVYEGEADVNAEGKASFELEFVKNQNFVVLFWAQDEDLTMFNIDDFRKVTLTTPGASNNVNAQVFAGSNVVTDCVPANGGKVTLSRPISQLNIATTAESLKFGTKDILLNKSTVTVTGLYPKYNVYTEAVSEGKTNFEYTEGQVPGTTIDVNGKTYTYVAMNYVGFAPKESTTVDVDFTIKTSEGDVTHSVPNVPVKPNYRTNIIGNLLTEAADYDVTLDAAWDDEEYTEVVVSTASDLQTEVNNILDGETGEITLGGDIDFGDLIGALTRAASDPASLIIPANKTVVLDLNGFTLSQTAKQTGAHSMIVNNGNLTIVDNKGNGKISYSDTGNGGEYVSNTIVNNGRLVIESGVIENNSSATVASNGYPHPVDNNGELIINGGTLTNNANYASMRIWCTTDDNTSVTINGGTFNGSIDFQTVSSAANKGSLTINGGTFIADTYTNCAVRLLGFGADVDEMLGYINGGTFNGEIALRNWSGADFNSQVFYITGGQFSADPTAFVVDGYPVNAPEAGDGYYTIGQFVPVAMVGDQEYGSLRAAVAAAQDGETITLVKDINQTDGVIITDKKLTIDLNNKTFTVTVGANTNNRNLKINGSSVVTIKNGTMVAAGEYSSGAYGTVRTEGTANVTLTNVKLYNYRGNGLNVKALSGTTVTISDTEVYSVYGGGIEAAGGTIELTNVKVEQKGMYTAPYNSMTISVNGGGTVTVNSGTYSTECITAEEANNQGTSHGPWCAGVLNSGGTLIIKGGTFSNDNFGENSLATAARGLLLADTGANIQINGGTFNAVKNIIDIQNNLGDAYRNPKATLVGGTYSSNPLTWDGLISVAEGYAVVENNNGTWNVADVKVYTETALKAAMADGRDVVLGADIVITEDWTPVGTSENPFNGMFNGNNHKITGLKVSGTDYAAFIAYAGKDAVIKNLTLENVDFNSTKHAAGVVCIASEGVTIENVTVSGAIVAASYAGGLLHNAANAVIKNCVNYADVSANRVGGIASWVTVNAIIENVQNNGNITGAVGASGIAHGFAGSIKNAVNYGAVTSNYYEAAAGIVGVQKAASTYEYCYNYGVITSTYDDPNASAAGILGQSAGSASTLNYCANYGTVSAEQSYAAGIAYSLYGTINASYCYNAGAVTGADGAGAIAPKAQYGTTDKANYCLNAGVVSSANGTVYQGSNNNVSCYYYNGSELLNVANNAVVSSADALSVLNGGSDKSFFTTEGGKIVVKK